MVRYKNDRVMNPSIFNIAIVGLGPKGFYAFERLVAQLKARQITQPIAIHLFNQNEFFGAGNIYRDDQPPYLIMNYANKNINCWTDELPKAITTSTLSFVDWLQSKTDDAKEHLEESFASRAKVGTYLMEGFAQIEEHLPDTISLVKHITTVRSIEKCGEKYQIASDNNGKNSLPLFDRILLSTGHLGSGAGFEEHKEMGPSINFIYPCTQAMGHIDPGARVALKGFGLTCIDAVLALTEGREGRFEFTESGKMTYIPSGKEPLQMFPYSRTGLPMMPRTGVSEDNHPLYILTEKRMSSLQGSRPVSFEQDILPWIIEECRFAYYRVLFKENAREFMFSSDFEFLNQQIDAFHNDFPELEKFHWDSLLDPFLHQTSLNHSEVSSYIEKLIIAAEKGPDQSPLNAAFATWRKISRGFNEIYSFGGLDAPSHRLFDQHYFGLFNRISYGPPVQNMKKILALAEAGIVDFTFLRGSSFIVSDALGAYGILEGNQQLMQAIDFHINAQIPRNNKSNTPGKLHQSLLEKGLGRKFLNDQNGHYCPGALDIDVQGKVIAQDGKVQHGITLYGTPTEGLTYDNDTLSRSRNNFASLWAEEVAHEIEKKELVNN